MHVSGRLCRLQLDVDLDECSSYPCLHNATCTDDSFAYACTCADGFSGYNCEIDDDECASNPCMNGATCDDSTTTGFITGHMYQCTCMGGYIKDLDLYLDCKKMLGFLAIVNSDETNLDISRSCRRSSRPTTWRAPTATASTLPTTPTSRIQIGRASCRERV